MKAINIKWDTDGDMELFNELPKEVDIPVGMTDGEDISDYLSDKTGFCHAGFELAEKLLINHYIGDDFNPSRQVEFIITEECLHDYLTETEDDRTVEEFIETYDSDESEIIYGYAANDGRILSDEITYCDDFIEKYNDFISRTQMFNPDMSAEQIATKENYYWTVYAN